MTDKALSESTWKSFVKGKALDDGAMLKALAKLAKAGDDDPQAQLDALDAVDAAAAALRKASKGDKAVGTQLDDMGKASAKARREAEAEKQRAKEHADDEEDSPALLTTKMIPLVRELRKGEARMPALITTAGKATAVLIMRRPISPSRRKLMLQAVDATGGAKHYNGECLFEHGALTFVLESPAGGMAKRVRAALLEQLSLRLKVVVRGDDGSTDADGEDEGEGAPGGAAAPSTSPVSPTPEPAPGRAAFDAVLARLQPRVAEALQKQHPQSTRLRAVEAFAIEKADGGDLVAAAKALTMIEQLLHAPTTAQETVADPKARDDALDGWRQQRDATVTMLKGLASEVASSGDVEARAVVIEITAVVKQLTAEPATRAQVRELLTWLENDDVVADVDELAEPIRAPLVQRLQVLQATMTA